MALLRKKIKASTLVESMIAMVVVMVSFGIATAVYVSVLSSSDEMQKLKSRTILQKLAIEIRQNHLFLDERTSIDDIIVEKKVVSYNNQKNLFQLKLIAFDQNEKKLAEYNELIQTE